ncbi:unnamed protein product [Brugia timori]|uniref:ZM domain-containing protein n=1 Tax=Brugia timori TaxID=42155 RepID=A0A0R3QVL0_9BILA|nr:unnamed protein product [Brugia timori]
MKSEEELFERRDNNRDRREGRNATYVYTTEYPPYYQYQPIHSPTQQTYVIQQQGSPGSVEEDVGAQLGHTTRASPATVSVLQNYAFNMISNLSNYTQNNMYSNFSL